MKPTLRTWWTVSWSYFAQIVELTVTETTCVICNLKRNVHFINIEVDKI